MGGTHEFLNEAYSREMSFQDKWQKSFEETSKVSKYYDPYESRGSTRAFSGTAFPRDTYKAPGTAQAIATSQDPQAPKRRSLSARRARQDWPYTPCENPAEVTIQYSDYLHMPTHVPSSLPRDAKPPRRWASNGVSRAYNGSYTSLGHTNFFGSRNTDPKQAAHKAAQRYSSLKHPSADSMSTRNIAFPASCPVHSYTPLPDWTKPRPGDSRRYTRR